MFYVVLGFVFP